MRRSARVAMFGAAFCLSVACENAHMARADAVSPSTTPPSSVTADYSTALRHGRELLRQSKPHEAAIALEAALKARPDDAVALSELGWALFLAGATARAQKVSERAAAIARDPKLRAASLYNLGRAAEAATDRAAALAAYRQSLKMRPSAEVHARLAALDPDVLALEQNKPYPIEKGTYRSVEAFCAQFLKNGSPGDECPKSFMKSWPFKETLELANPLPSVSKLEVFYVYSKLASCYRSYVSFEIEKKVSIYELGSCADYLVNDIKPQDMGKGNSPVVAFSVVEQTPDRQTGSASTAATLYFSKSLFLCGVGRSAALSCTPLFELERTPADQLSSSGVLPAPPPKWEHKWLLDFDQPGSLRLTPDGWWPSDDGLLKQVGRHRILFP